MFRIPPLIGAKVTDKVGPVSQKVTDLTFEEMEQAKDIMSNGAIWELSMVLELVGTHQFNKWEIELMDKIVQEYTTRYKSPLAKALGEE